MPKYCCIMGVTLAESSEAGFVAARLDDGGLDDGGLDGGGLDGGGLEGIVIPRK